MKTEEDDRVLFAVGSICLALSNPAIAFLLGFLFMIFLFCYPTEEKDE